jgi:diadenosine tetraphosphate (Ap4A) HIT family hydrolase
MPDNAIELFNQSKHRVYEGEYWNVIMSYNQGYLGRSIVYLKSRIIADTLALTAEEHSELWDSILPRLTKALKDAFGADRINYAHLANHEKHVHWHVVPRYDSPVEFGGIEFVDPKPNGNFVTGEKDLSPEILDNIFEEIRKHY